MFGADDLLTGRRLVLIHHLALVVDDLQNRHRRHPAALVGKHRISARQLQQRYLAAAKGQRQAVVFTVERGDAKPFGLRDQSVLVGSDRVVVDADILQRLDRRNVVRIGQRRSHGHGYVKFIIVVYWGVRPAGVVWITGGW